MNTNYNYEVELFDDEGKTTKKLQFKKLTDVNDKFPNLNYYTIRELYLLGEGKKTRKFVHHNIAILQNKMKIRSIKSELSDLLQESDENTLKPPRKRRTVIKKT